MGSYLVGLTGPIGSGKSSVAEVWRQNGAAVVEGDEMGRRALTEDAQLRHKLAKRFGEDILNPDGTVNRQLLGLKGFASKANSDDLTRLTFPTLYRLAHEEFVRLGRDHRVVVFDAALIYEWCVERDFDLIIVVTAPHPLLLSRVASRLHITCAMADERLSRQLSPDDKARRADRIIINDGTMEQLIEEAERVWGEVVNRWG